MRELTLLFGSSAHATAGTLTVFFGGLAIGGAVWSRRAPRSQRPLAEYGLLELGVGLSGVLYFLLMGAYAAIYSPLHQILGDSPTLLSAAKLLLAAGVLLPPAVLMGGTLPLVAQYAVSSQASLGRVGTMLYGVNTFGAATGALAAGFWLPEWIGFNGAYLVAVVASLIIGAVALALDRREAPVAADGSPTNARTEHPTEHGQVVSLASPKLMAAAATSGALALALEVLWTRMFQQVLQNSVYTFSIILTTFLAALAGGAFVARRVARSRVDPWNALAVLATACAVGTLATPFMFYELTGGMRYLGAGEGWFGYLSSVIGGAVLVLFIPGVAAGSLFPYLLRVAERSGEPGQVVGRLAAINTAGAIVGSLLAGFVVLESIGLWRGLLLVALAYFALALFVTRSRVAALSPALGILLALAVANPSTLPGVRLDEGTERLLASWEGADGYVAVVERNGHRRIKINNFYSLGSSAAMQHEQNQTLIPLLPHPNPSQLFYLGMGTGITAGAGLRLPSEQVTVTELVPAVVTAAAEYFGPQASGLFSDPRARVLARDGRNELRGDDERYDAILADLFVPWRAGVGNLYSRDHYATALSRLQPGGVYVQWIPLYQVTDKEFWTIVRSFLDVFPQVQVWRGDFFVEQPILALVGSADAMPVTARTIIRNGRHLRSDANIDPVTFLAVTLPFYAGNLGESREIVPSGPLHTDDNPVIEYQAPVSHRDARAGTVEWFTGLKLIEFLERLHAATPPETDPYLADLDPAARGFVAAGLAYHKGAILNQLGRVDESRRLLQEFVSLIPVEIEFATKGQASSIIEESE
ncbi:MAG: fused MFS/spermidine synthase [Pseudomonadota bacterium]